MNGRRAAVAGAVLAALAGMGLWWWSAREENGFDREATARDVLSEESTARVRATCGSCHAFPEPDILPREVWPEMIRGMYLLAREDGLDLPAPPPRVVAWYLLQAPDTLPPAPGRTDAGPGPVLWSTEGWRPPGAPAPGEGSPAVTHVQATRLFDGPGDDVLVSDVMSNRVYALRTGPDGLTSTVLGSAPHPARVAVTDLDGDGLRDVVVAALGALAPTNEQVGEIVWLRRTGPGTFEEVVLADGLGRVADVQATDVNGDGRTDLVVAIFGWRENGSLVWLENRGMRDPAGSGPARPDFAWHVLDPRAGYTDGRAVDLDGDGRLEVVGLLTQELQHVVAFRPEPDGSWRQDVLFAAPSPDWGYTGLTVTDWTGDGLPDLVLTHGDALDVTLAKPHHGVTLLENRGDGGFVHRRLTHMYGAHKAVAVDPDGDGLPGLVVAAYLPPGLSRPAPGPPESLVWLQRVGPDSLVRRVLKGGDVAHMTVASGDLGGDGSTDLVLGWMDLGVVDPEQEHRGQAMAPWVTVWMETTSAAGEGPGDGTPPAGSAQEAGAAASR